MAFIGLTSLPTISLWSTGHLSEGFRPRESKVSYLHSINQITIIPLSLNLINLVEKKLNITIRIDSNYPFHRTKVPIIPLVVICRRDAPEIHRLMVGRLVTAEPPTPSPFRTVPHTDQGHPMGRPRGIKRLAILTFMIIQLITNGVWRRKLLHLPRALESIAGVMSFVAGTSVTRDFNGLEQMDMIGEMVRILTQCIGPSPLLNHPHPQESLKALSPQPAFGVSRCRSGRIIQGRGH